MEAEFVTIIQHPSGAHKQIALRENEVVKKEEQRPVLVYRTDTAPGSSGAPCFNDQWQVVALHSRGVPETEPGTERVKLRNNTFVDRRDLARIPGLRDTDIVWSSNLGVRVSRICAHLREEAEAARRAGSPANPLLAALLRDIAQGGPPVVSPRGARPGAAAAAGRDAGDGDEADADAEAARRRRRAGSGRAGAPTRRPPPAPGRGYRPDFLRGHTVPLPEIGPRALTFGRASTNRETGGTELGYQHFSTLHCADRQLAFVAAVNIDGRKSVPLERGRDRWSYDPRLPEDEQAGDWLYKEEGGNFFDRGHLVRRLDPC